MGWVMGEAATPGAPSSSPSNSVLKRAELRRHPRFRIEEARTELFSRTLLGTLGLGRKNEARAAVNLSEGGVLVVTPAKLKVGARVQIRIEMEKYKDSISADGEIRWCFQSAKDAADYYAGIQFLNLASQDASKIAKMREWFTSPEYKQKTATRRRLGPPDRRA